MSAESFVIDDLMNVGVECGQCGGQVYFETCETTNGQAGHYQALVSECQRCGFRYKITDSCPECSKAGVS